MYSIDKIFCKLKLQQFGYLGDIDDATAVQEFLTALCVSRVKETMWFDYKLLELRTGEWETGAMTWNNLAYDLLHLQKTDHAYENRIKTNGTLHHTDRQHTHHRA